MDYNEYALSVLIEQRHAEMVAQARQAADLRRHGARRGEVRAAVGAALIRLGAWLLREDYAAPSGAPVR
jgi:hypothetical protein